MLCMRTLIDICSVFRVSFLLFCVVLQVILESGSLSEPVFVFRLELQTNQHHIDEIERKDGEVQDCPVSSKPAKLIEASVPPCSPWLLDVANQREKHPQQKEKLTAHSAGTWSTWCSIGSMMFKSLGVFLASMSRHLNLKRTTSSSPNRGLRFPCCPSSPEVISNTEDWRHIYIYIFIVYLIYINIRIINIS